jgi:hypothetical protein
LIGAVFGFLRVTFPLALFLLGMGMPIFFGEPISGSEKNARPVRHVSMEQRLRES